MSSKSYSFTTSADNRVQLDSTGGGKFVAPMAVSSDPGSLALRTGDFSNINLSGAKLKLGMTGAEVLGLLDRQATLATQQLQAVTDYGAGAIAAVQQNKAAELTAATGDLPNWQRYIPLGVGAAVLLILALGRRV